MMFPHCFPGAQYVLRCFKEGGERLARFFVRPRWSLKPKVRRGLSEEATVN